MYTFTFAMALVCTEYSVIILPFLKWRRGFGEDAFLFAHHAGFSATRGSIQPGIGRDVGVRGQGHPLYLPCLPGQPSAPAANEEAAVSSPQSRTK